jgi:proline racemase
MEFKRHFSTVDMHTAGEPLRIITAGLPFIKGNTILEKRAFFRENLDDIRQVLMYEPRGHHGMYGCIMTPPVNEGSDFGVLFLHNEGYSSMCGHGIIAVVTYALETGLIAIRGEKQEVVIDSPAGKITALATCKGSRVKSVAFENVPSFVYYEDLCLPSLGDIRVDISYGGAFYAIVEAQDLGVKVEIEQLSELQRLGVHIKQAIEAMIDVKHPHEADINGIYGVIISDQAQRASSHLRNVTVFAEGQIDRSPCGTGTAARIALLKHKGQLNIGEAFVHESIIGSQLIGEILSKTKVGNYTAFVPRITGRAFMTGIHQFVVDPSDPLYDGFLLR